LLEPLALDSHKKERDALFYLTKLQCSIISAPADFEPASSHQIYKMVAPHAPHESAVLASRERLFFMLALEMVGTERVELSLIQGMSLCNTNIACVPIEMVAGGALESPRSFGYEPNN